MTANQTLASGQRLAALSALSLGLQGTLDSHVIAGLLLDHLAGQVRLAAVSLHLLDPQTGRFGPAFGRSVDAPAGDGHGLGPAASRAVLASPSARVVALPDLAEAEAAQLASRGFRNYYGVPLRAAGQTLGVLEAYLSEGALSPADLEYIQASAVRAALALHHARQFEAQQRAYFELLTSFDQALEGWARAMDMRSKETEGHTRRVTELTVRLARALNVSEDELVHMRRGALLHDIGRAGLPDGLLLKPGSLSAEEWALMCRHPAYAYDLLYPIEKLRPALDIPYSHHERWDGTGYPRRLKGEAIPFAARIFAVVDVWDTLQSDRPYRPGQLAQQAQDYLRAESGKQFDPHVVEVFLSMMEAE